MDKTYPLYNRMPGKWREAPMVRWKGTEVDVEEVHKFLDVLVNHNLAWELLAIPRLKVQFDITYDEAKKLWNGYVAAEESIKLED